jgi:hypothetical protein
LRTCARSAEHQHPGLGDEGGARSNVHHLQGSVPDAHRPGPVGVPRALSSSMGQREQLEFRSKMGPWIVWHRFRQFYKLDMKLEERCLPLEHRSPCFSLSVSSLCLSLSASVFWTD